MPSADLANIHTAKNIHLIGIGGCGMSAIAKILFEMNYKISGSDAKEGANTIRLKDIGVKVFIGHERSQVRDADIIVYSSAIAKDNPEMMEASAKGIPLLKRAEMLAWIMRQSKNRIAVAGTHGKTTTTAMTAKVLESAHKKPTYMIGCDMDYIESNAKHGIGDFMVTEADESDSSFLFYSPTVEIITNIEADHMEHFGNMDELVSVFKRFVERLPADGILIAEGTDANITRVLKTTSVKKISYGLNTSSDFYAKDLSFIGYNSSYILMHKQNKIGEVNLSVPGWQNVVNSLAVFAFSFEFGIEFNQAANALRTFVGARRRFSTIGEQSGVLIIDDYAHHPTEIRATLSAARSGWPERKIISIFQPHRYSRTSLLKEQFADAFDDADKVIITDIYAASESPLPGISGKSIADLISPKKAVYVPKKEQIPEMLANELRDGDIVLTIGAGDIYTIGKELLSRLKMK